MSSNDKCQDSYDVACPASIDSIFTHLKQATSQLNLIAKKYSEMEEDVKTSGIVQGQVMLKYARQGAELAECKQKLKDLSKDKQSEHGMNCLINDQRDEINVLYSLLKQYQVEIKDGIGLVFKSHLGDKNGLKFQHMIEKSIDAATQKIIIGLCVNPKLSNSKAIDCAKWLRENACEDKDSLNDIVKCVDNK